MTDFQLPETLLEIAKLAGANPAKPYRGFDPAHSITLIPEINGSAACLQSLGKAVDQLYRELSFDRGIRNNAGKEVVLPGGIKGTMPRLPKVPKEGFRSALKHIVHSLAYAASNPLTKPGGKEIRRECVALPMTPNAYGTGNEYAALSFRATKGVILALGSYKTDEGEGPWLTVVRGNDFGEGRWTRIGPSDHFKTWMLHRGLIFPMHPYGRRKRHSKANKAVLWRSERSMDDDPKAQHIVDRPLQGDEMILLPVNARLARAKIECRLPDYAAYVETWDYGKGRSKLPHGARKLYRVFSGKDGNGGRLFGNEVQRLPGHVRKEYLTIDGQPTAELDYGSMQLVLLYAMEGVPVPQGDLYDPEGQGAGYRELMKDVLTVSVGSATRADTISALADKWRKENRSRASKAPKMYDEFWDRHRVVCPHDRSGEAAWGRLQFVESNIALRVLRYMEAQKIVVIPIHDSFIVQARHEGKLREAMLVAFADFYPNARVLVR